MGLTQEGGGEVNHGKTCMFRMAAIFCGKGFKVGRIIMKWKFLKKRKSFWMRKGNFRVGRGF